MKQTPTRRNLPGLSWSAVLDSLLPQRKIPCFTKFNGAVELSRTWDANLRCGVWSKVYRSGFELAAFNEWEFDILKRLAQFKVPHTYRAVLLEREGSALASSRTPGGVASSQITIKTEHEGPTLADICRMPTHRGGDILAHFFACPIQYLRLTRSLLVSLDAIHKNHFVHCDVHAGNIAISMADLGFQGDEREPSRIYCEPRVDKLKFIDFGFSIDRRSPPYTTLPFLRNGYNRKISQQFASLLEDVDRQARSHLEPGEHWSEVMLDPIFWRRLDQNPLHMLCQVDFREDLFQLGVMLSDLRDGRGEFSDLGGGTVDAPPGSEVGRLINSLPERLKTFATSATQVVQGQYPHVGLIAEIDKALMGLSGRPGSDGGETLDLHRNDFGGLASDMQSNRNETAIQHVQKIQPKRVEERSDPGRHGKSDRSAPKFPDRLDDIPVNLVATFESGMETPIAVVYDKRGVLGNKTALQGNSWFRRKSMPLFLFTGVVAAGGLVIFALATKDAGVVHLAATSALPFANASQSTGVLVPASQEPTSRSPTPRIPDLPPQLTQEQIEQKAQSLAQHLGISVVNEHYSGGRSVDVKLIDFEHGRSPAYRLNVDISWRGNFLGQDGYQAKGVITVASDDVVSPSLGSNANWNPSWTSDRLSAWLATRGAARQLLTRPQQ